MYVVPKGVDHRPVANEEVHLLLIDPTGTPNTGDPDNGGTAQDGVASDIVQERSPVEMPGASPDCG